MMNNNRHCTLHICKEILKLCLPINLYVVEHRTYIYCYADFQLILISCYFSNEGLAVTTYQRGICIQMHSQFLIRVQVILIN